MNKKKCLNSKWDGAQDLFARMLTSEKSEGHELVRQALRRGIISIDQYVDFLRIAKECEENEEE